MSIYLDLTRAFNDGALRAVLSGGPAVVLRRLAVMSKDGDWIVRETQDALQHVLTVLGARGARYRFGAPLDVRWMAGGWSAHLEFPTPDLRLRTDFVTRPPRLTSDDVASMWREFAEVPVPFLDARRLIELKQTNREKDYAVIGELARLLTDARTQMLTSRSARDLARLAREHPAWIDVLRRTRPLLAVATGPAAELEQALDAERRALMHANERRLQAYLDAAAAWRAAWPGVERELAGRPLAEAHRHMVERAFGVLPFTLPTEPR